MKKATLLMVLFLFTLAGTGFAQSEPRFYFYEYFVLHDAKGKVLYDIDHEKVVKKVFEKMGMEPSEDSPEKIKIPPQIQEKEIYPAVGETVYFFTSKQKKPEEAEVKKVYFQYDKTMRRYVPAFDYDYKAPKNRKDSAKGNRRTNDSVPGDYFISVPDETLPEDPPKKIKLEPYLRKKVLEQIRLKYKDLDLDSKKIFCQFIGVMGKKYVVVMSQPNLGLNIDVYEVGADGVLRKVCGEHFNLFT